MEITIKINKEQKLLLEVMTKKMGLERRDETLIECLKLSGFLEKYINKDNVLTVVDHSINKEVNILVRDNT